MVDRYSPDFDEEDQGPVMLEDAEGDYVTIEAYADLEIELAAIKDKYADLNELVTDLAWSADRLNRRL